MFVEQPDFTGYVKSLNSENCDYKKKFKKKGFNIHIGKVHDKLATDQKTAKKFKYRMGLQCKHCKFKSECTSGCYKTIHNQIRCIHKKALQNHEETGGGF